MWFDRWDSSTVNWRLVINILVYINFRKKKFNLFCCWWILEHGLLFLLLTFPVLVASISLWPCFPWKKSISNCTLSCRENWKASLPYGQWWWKASSSPPNDWEFWWLKIYVSITKSFKFVRSCNHSIIHYFNLIFNDCVGQLYVHSSAE